MPLKIAAHLFVGARNLDEQLQQLDGVELGALALCRHLGKKEVHLARTGAQGAKGEGSAGEPSCGQRLR